MASRLVRSTLGPARLASASTARPIARATALPLTQHRRASNVPTEDPKSRAQSLIDALPGSSLVSKTAILSAGAGVSIWGVANEILVINEETVVAFCLLSVFWAVSKYGGPLYSSWADGQIEKMKGILNGARADHTNSVKARIENVQQLAGVVDVTKQLFEVSKETAKLEAQAFELEQRTALAKEAKTVLDSWVRYEGQVKVRQQKELAESVIAKVSKDLENPRVLQQILQQSVSDVEKLISSKAQ